MQNGNAVSHWWLVRNKNSREHLMNTRHFTLAQKEMNDQVKKGVLCELVMVQEVIVDSGYRFWVDDIGCINGGTIVPTGRQLFLTKKEAEESRSND